MPKFVEMDEQVTLQMQMEENTGAVILINTFTVKPEDVDQLLSAWTEDSLWMREQPGYISTQMHRGIGGSTVFVNYAIWETAEDFKRAFNTPEFQSKLSLYPSESLTSPHLFEKVAVPRVCVD